MKELKEKLDALGMKEYLFVGYTEEGDSVEVLKGDPAMLALLNLIIHSKVVMEITAPGSPLRPIGRSQATPEELKGLPND